MDLLSEIFLWASVIVICLGVLAGVIIIIFSKGKIKKISLTPTSKFGLFLVIVGMFIYLLSNVGSFHVDETVNNCIDIRINQENANQTDPEKCFTKEQHDQKWIMFLIGIGTSVVIVIGTVLIEIGRNN